MQVSDWKAAVAAGILAALLAGATAWGGSPSPSPKPSMTASDSIGVATMKKDGTIVLQLRAQDGAGTVGDAQIEYKKDNSHYQEILKHLGGLRPGQSKPVPPWKEK